MQRCKNGVIKPENPEQLRILIYNNYHDYISLGGPWKLQYYKDEKWQDLEYKIGFLDNFTAIDENESYETVIDMHQFEKTLGPGLYKLIQIIDFYESHILYTPKKPVDSCEMINYFTII